MCLIITITLALSFGSVIGYQAKNDGIIRKIRDSDNISSSSFVYIKKEHQDFRDSGICRDLNVTGVEVCDEKKSTVTNFFTLKETHCFCDEECHRYHDCCIDRVKNDQKRNDWTCREINHPFLYSIYVIQQCPATWEESSVRTRCEVEAVDLEAAHKPYSFLQDIAVLGAKSHIFYRNAYCALCNGDTELVHWNSYFSCGENVTSEQLEKLASSDELKYVARKKYFRASADGHIRTCRLQIEQFHFRSMLSIYGGRLCKSVIDKCNSNGDENLEKLCNAYTSYVYKSGKDLPGRKNSHGKIYKNFHCALCNGVQAKELTCNDPYNINFYSASPIPKNALSLLMLFDFVDTKSKYVANVGLCRMAENQMWDPFLNKCLNVACGRLYKLEGTKCVPIQNLTSPDGIKSSCPKLILSHDMFTFLENRSVYINYSEKTLTSDYYEVYERDKLMRITKILICAEDNYLLPVAPMHCLLSEITISISIICLILHLAVYGIIPKLRNCPGKVLMSLSASLLCGHFALLIAPYLRETHWACYFNAVILQAGYLSAFFWMNVMAFDIYRTFSMTQIHSPNPRTYIKYFIYSSLSVFSIICIGITVDFASPTSSEFRPKYADPLCWFNHKRGLLVFFAVPVALLLLANFILFTIAAFSIQKISKQAKMVNKSSEKVRYFLYIKLSVVLGLTWSLGFLAAISNVEFLWYPFIVLNGLQGAIIFVIFTLKRKTLHTLTVKLKLRCHTYKFGEKGGLKKTMYSSLSNLSTLQTTLTTGVVLPALNETPEMLRAIRKLNSE